MLSPEAATTFPREVSSAFPLEASSAFPLEASQAVSAEKGKADQGKQQPRTGLENWKGKDIEMNVEQLACSSVGPGCV